MNILIDYEHKVTVNTEYCICLYSPNQCSQRWSSMK